LGESESYFSKSTRSLTSRNKLLAYFWDKLHTTSLHFHAARCKQRAQRIYGCVVAETWKKFGTGWTRMLSSHTNERTQLVSKKGKVCISSVCSRHQIRTNMRVNDFFCLEKVEFLQNTLCFCSACELKWICSSFESIEW
jgi:hypothetical protein